MHRQGLSYIPENRTYMQIRKIEFRFLGLRAILHQLVFAELFYTFYPVTVSNASCLTKGPRGIGPRWIV